MIDVTDKSYVPSLEEIGGYIENPLFDALCARLQSAYGAATELAYSRDALLPGWNVRFHKSGRALCRAYPKRGFFTVLVVVGRREKERVEALLPAMSESMRALYSGTKEGMGQRWLMVDLAADDALYQDVLRLVAIRRESR